MIDRQTKTEVVVNGCDEFAVAMSVQTHMGGEPSTAAFVPDDVTDCGLSEKFLARVPEFIHVWVSIGAKIKAASRERAGAGIPRRGFGPTRTTRLAGDISC